ncbi:MAG: hypothetical protein ATN36_01890 [Epulopiscium sp. Nele67-Bin005]|nr:MAG: hypothetical protein ATN36_01890 [Epulopiscium sp. Nele67-Bin005]
MSSFLNNFFGMILNLIFEGIVLLVPVGALGVTIIMFTLVTRILLTPLQLKQQHTSRAMSKVQPELLALQKQYAHKTDQASKMEYSQEMQKLYQKYNINPLAGCLPLLIQIPLIYVLYNVLRQPSRYISKLKELYVVIADTIMDMVPNYEQVIDAVISVSPMTSTAQYELDKMGGGTLADKLSHFTTAQWAELTNIVPENVSLALTDLMQVKHDYEWFFVNLIDTPAQLVETGMYAALLVPILAGASTYIFSKISMANNKPAQPANSTPTSADMQTESMMKIMMNITPIMMGFFSYTVPSGLALYWISGNVIMMGQQAWIMKIVQKQEAILEEQLRKDREEAKLNAKKNRPKKQNPHGNKNLNRPPADGNGTPRPKKKRPNPNGEQPKKKRPPQVEDTEKVNLEKPVEGIVEDTQEIIVENNTDED